VLAVITPAGAKVVQRAPFLLRLRRLVTGTIFFQYSLSALGLMPLPGSVAGNTLDCAIRPMPKATQKEYNHCSVDGFWRLLALSASMPATMVLAGGRNQVSETHQANCFDYRDVDRARVHSRLRLSANSDSERARCYQHDHRAALLRCGIEERQIGLLLSRSPKADLCELFVSPPWLQPLLVSSKAYPATHPNVVA